jgi:hypothetical protein
MPCRSREQVLLGRPQVDRDRGGVTPASLEQVADLGAAADLRRADGTGHPQRNSPSQFAGNIDVLVQQA